MKTRIDTLLRGAVQRGDVPGVTAVATDVNGTNYEGGFGKTILGQDADMTPDTVVWIASMTKAVTGAVAMQQVERGTLKLDTPAKDVIPYLGEVQVLEGFDTDGKPRLRKPVRDITLRHLLTHTAGFGYDIWNPEILRYREVMDVPTIGTGLDKSLTTPLLFDPGVRWQYGIGIDWTGKMVEAVTGRKLGQVMQDDLFDPSVQLAGAGSAAARRPRLPIRLMASLLYLKHAYKLSDEELVERWAENVVWQHFSGMTHYEPRLPCDATPRSGAFGPPSARPASKNCSRPPS